MKLHVWKYTCLPACVCVYVCARHTRLVRADHVIRELCDDGAICRRVLHWPARTRQQARAASERTGPNLRPSLACDNIGPSQANCQLRMDPRLTRIHTRSSRLFVH